MPPHVEPLMSILLEWQPPSLVQIGPASSFCCCRLAFTNYPPRCRSAWRWPTPEVPCVQWAPIQTVPLPLRTCLAPAPSWEPCLHQRCPCSSRWGRYKAGSARSSRSVGSTPWSTLATFLAFSCMTATTMTCRTRWAPYVKLGVDVMATLSVFVVFIFGCDFLCRKMTSSWDGRKELARSGARARRKEGPTWVWRK